MGTAPSKFGRQSAYQVLSRERWSVAHAAREINIHYPHLLRALMGVVRPCEEVRERLPRLLGVPLESLFTEEILAEPYVFARGRRPAMPPNSGYVSKAALREARARRLQEAAKS